VPARNVAGANAPPTKAIVTRDFQALNFIDILPQKRGTENALPITNTQWIDAAN
jgi:hypothetical protein